MIKFNWVDIFCLILLFRIGYISFKNGIFTEIFKFFAILVGIVVGLHFYDVSGKFIETHIFLPSWISQEFAIIGIILLIYLLFFLLKLCIQKIMSAKFEQQVDRGGALFFGVIRSFLTVSMVLVCLNLLPVKYIQRSIWDCSLSAPVIIKIAPLTYKYIMRFWPNTHVNEVFKS